MTSYFEIGGEIIELIDIAQSPELREFVTEAVIPVLGLASEAAMIYHSSKSESRDQKDSLAEHYVKMATMPFRKGVPPMLLDLVTGRPFNPVLFAVRGVGIYALQVQYNYDYFIKGESHDW